MGGFFFNFGRQGFVTFVHTPKAEIQSLGAAFQDLPACVMLIPAIRQICISLACRVVGVGEVQLV